MKEPKDKRTKEWKEWKANREFETAFENQLKEPSFKNLAVEYQEPDGLGDVVEKFTESTGIKALVKEIIGDDCGCDKRKDQLNKFSESFLSMFKRGKKPIQCFTPELYEAYGNYVKTRSINSWTEKDVKLVIDCYARVFATQYHSRDLCRSCQGSAKILLNLQKS